MGACVATSKSNSIPYLPATNSSNMAYGSSKHKKKEELHRILSNLSSTNSHITVSTLNPTRFSIVSQNQGQGQVLVNEEVPYKEIGMIIESVDGYTIENRYKSFVNSIKWKPKMEKQK